MRQKFCVKFMIGILLLSLAGTAGIPVYADQSGELVDTMRAATLVTKAPSPMEINKVHGGFGAVIEQLVQEGKLTREKAEQIDKFIKQKEAERKNQKEQKRSPKNLRYGIVNELVDAKIINGAEAEAIRSKFKELREKALEEKLGQLVKKGTLTQTQADQVKTYFINAGKEREEQFKKLQGMTEEQRKAFFKEHKKDSVMNKLVEDKVLTKEQAQELRNSLGDGHKGDCGKH